MGSISNASLTHGLRADGATTSTNISGSLSIGLSQQRLNLDGVDVSYSFIVTSNAAGDVATLNLSSGVVSQTTGTPVILDGDGEDFEGQPLPTSLSISGLHTEFQTVGGGTISMACADDGLPDIVASSDGVISQTAIPAGKTLAGNDVTFTFTESGQVVVVIVASKTV